MKKITLLILLFTSFALGFAQSGVVIKGRVIDKETQETLIGVAVVLESSSSTGTITDVNGNFEITVPASQSLLVFSYVGFKTETIEARNNMVVELEPNPQGLDEVVVIGYGSMKKSDLTGSVSSIKSKDLNVISSANVQASMAGRAAGVQVISSGSVDGAVKVRVRGIGTINNSDPLYVVDGFSTNDISYLAPSDIQSMEILKDASATAVYGSRGANGVILITTNKGVNQPTRVNVNSYFGMSTIAKKLDVLDAATYARARTEAYDQGGMSMEPNDLAIIDYAIANNSKGTDWQKEVLRTAVVQNYNVNVVGGSEKTKYNLSATYNSNEGVLKNAFVDKLIIRLSTDYQLYKNVKFGSDISFVDYKTSMSDLSNMYAATLMVAARSAPVSSVYDQYGNWQSNMSRDSNPARKSDHTKYDKKHGNQFVGNFYLNIDILKGLSFKSTFGAAYSNTKQNNYIPTYYVSPQESITTSQLTEYRNSNINWIWSNVATYNLELNKVHKFNAMVGTEATYDKYDGINATAYDVAENTDMRYLSAAKSSQYMAGSSQGSSSIFSTFVRLNYSYNSKYLLTATLRSDVSSRFAKENRQGVFPSVSLGWNIKEEEFLKEISFISQAKLRAGWGMVGNQSSTGIGDYLSTIANGKRYVLGGQVYEGRIPEYLSNSQLKWEVAKQTNVGLDLGFFNSKLTLSADYFIKDTKDMIVRAPIPDYVGALAPLANVGSMRNKGFEFTINHNNEIDKVKYNVGLNMSFIKNEVTSLGRSGAIFATLFDRLPSTSKTEVGHPIASYWGYETDGIFHTQEELDAYTYTDKDGNVKPIQPTAEVGDVKYVDRDGNGSIDAEDQTYLGDYIPTFTGGLNLGIEYKDFTFSLFTDFSYGGKIANMNLFHMKSPLMGANILQSYYDNRWTPETPYNSEPRLTTSSQSGQNTLFSDRYIEDGSFLRIRNVQLGYYLPKNLLQKVKIESLKVYVSADNLHTFTKYSGYNPEITDQWGNPLTAGSDVGSTPLPRTLSVGFNLIF
ncbi:MAG: TonB-dependent receptor [Dysgonomonas sp.]|nr:TonB-dependent receptor [Dysgonomonas sp.]